MTHLFDRFEDLPFVVRFPKGYEEGKQYPTILFFHGIGNRGDDPAALLPNPFFKHTEEQFPDFPFVCIAPICPVTVRWVDVFEALERFACYAVGLPYVDPARYYLAGTSMGGHIAWELAMSMPRLFAATVPVCGRGTPWRAARLLGLPLWAFHGEEDDVVVPEGSTLVIDRLRRAGGTPRFTLIPGVKHDAWHYAYTLPDLFDWLLLQSNPCAPRLAEMIADGTVRV